MAKICFLIFIFLGKNFLLSSAAAFGDDNWMNKLLLDKIQTLEKRMDIDMKILKSELKREIRGANRRVTGKRDRMALIARKRDVCVSARSDPNQVVLS